MNAAEWNEERRSALAAATEFERMAGCRHLFGQYGNCAYCGATAKEVGA